jgi:hypothetical protein
MVPAWLLAIVVFLGVCVLGWYSIYSHHEGVPEGFATAPPTPPTTATIASHTPAPSAIATHTAATKQDTEYTSLAGQASSNTPPILHPSMAPLLQSVMEQLGKGMIVPVVGAGGQDHPPTPSYTPSQTVLPPHKTPVPQAPRLTATSKTDGFTGVADIQTDAIRTPSVRQHIRDDTTASPADVKNEYEITYEVDGAL